MDPVILAAGWYFVFLFSVTAHEAAHSLLAWLGGDSMAYDSGQVSLSPIPHMQREPVGMVLLPLLMVATVGFPLGWASAPYDPFWAARYPKRAAIMALAGPASNFLIALVTGFILWLGLQLGWWIPVGGPMEQLMASPDGSFSPVAMLFSMLFAMNLLLAVLNMMPLPPLDGSGVVPLFLNDRQTERYNEFIHQPIFSLVGLIVVWKVFPFVFAPILQFAVMVILS